MTRNLCVFTEITRTNTDGEAEEVPVIVYFDIESYSRGYPATWEEPGCGPEYEFSFDRAEIDTPSPDDAPLTDAEITGLKAWFETEDAHDEAIEAAERDRDDGPDPDEAYERAQEDRRLERMFGGAGNL